MFRSITEGARLTASGVELEMYLQPTQNVWWKYRAKNKSRPAEAAARTLRILAPQSAAH